MARLYANENFPLPVVKELRRLGHDVLTIHETGKAGQSVPDETVLAFARDITAFRDVPLADLPTVAEDLCHVPPPWTGWGRWRAVAHDFVYEISCAVAV